MRDIFFYIRNVEFFKEIYLFLEPRSMAYCFLDEYSGPECFRAAYQLLQLTAGEEITRHWGKIEFDPFISWHAAVSVGMTEKLLANIEASPDFTEFFLLSLREFFLWQLLSNVGFFRHIKQENRPALKKKIWTVFINYQRRGLIVYISQLQHCVTEE